MFRRMAINQDIYRKLQKAVDDGIRDLDAQDALDTVEELEAHIYGVVEGLKSDLDDGED